MPKKKVDSIIFRCVDCMGKYRVGDSFPSTKLEVEGMSHLSKEQRENIFQQLAVNLGTFCKFVYGKYGLEVKKAEVSLELETIITGMDTKAAEA